MAAIEGTVFHDANANGQQDFFPNDDQEAGLSGWTVFVDKNGNGQLDLTRKTFVSTAHVDIPDLGQGASPLLVGNLNGAIADVDVTLDISHTYIADLRAFLISPAGTRVELFSRIGGDNDAITSKTLDDEAVTSISNPQNTAPFSGSFRPAQPLSAFDGESPNGTWTLEVHDEAGSDTGVITRFQLSIGVTGNGSEPFAVTDESGAYRIDGLSAGTYAVREIVQPGFRQTFPEEGPQSVTVKAGLTNLDVDFGNTELPGSIRGQVWDDLNGNGMREDNEPGSNDWTLELLNADTLAVVASTQSTSIDLNGDTIIDPLTETGLYQFDELKPAHYLVREVLQNGWKETAPEANTSVVDEDPVTQAGAFSIAPPPTGTVDSPAPWLPDLVVDMQETSGLRSAFLDGDTLRFGQATPNVGFGPLRLVGGPDNGGGTQIVYQRIYDDHGGFTDRKAGNFFFHPEHNHIHFNDFARYSLRMALPDSDGNGQPEVGDVIRGGTKTSFCLVDVQPYSTETPLPNAAPDRSGFFCDTQQQISVGWEDIYGSGTEGQEINVAGLAPGDYWLEATIDPSDRFLETNENNNSGRVLIHLGAAERVHRITIHSGQTVDDQNFANFQQINVTGKVFTDANLNGRQDRSEIGRAGVAVFIDINGDHILNNPVSGDGVADGLAQEPWALTDHDGNFTFPGLNPGSYQVRMVAPTGNIQTTETPSNFEAISGHDVAVGSFGIGLLHGATTQVTTAENGHLVINDISPKGQSDRLTVRVEGFSGLAGVAPQVRIHDPDHILITTIGIQEGLHTVFIPINQSLQSNLVEINGGNGNDVITVDLGPSPGTAFINGGPGNDTLTIIGGQFPNPTGAISEQVDPIHNHDHTGEQNLEVMLDGTAFFEVSTINGGTGNDRIVARDAMRGVVLNGDDGQDSMTGGSGHDTIHGDRGNDTLAGGGGNDQLFGDDGNDRLNGEVGSDTLQGDQGNDSLQGGNDDDQFRWNNGDDSDTLDGGGGADQLTVNGAATSEVFAINSLGGSKLKLQRTNNALFSLEIANCEAVAVVGNNGNDSLSAGPGVAGRTSLSFDGGLGNDMLQLAGTTGNDVIRIASFAESNQLGNNQSPTVTVFKSTERVVANLDAGNDRLDASAQAIDSLQITVRGEAGKDTLIGGAESDSLLGGDGDDSLSGGYGNDTLAGENGNDSLSGDEGADSISGANGFDKLHGGSGDDSLSGGNDDDTLCGEEGNDLLSGDRGNDTLLGGSDEDTLMGGAGNDALLGMSENDHLDGGDGKDTLVGGTGDDQLLGGNGNDLLIGDEGGDTLSGEADHDTLVGDTGIDSFVNHSLDEVVKVFRFGVQRLLDLC